jgi:hypothetical protein
MKTDFKNTLLIIILVLTCLGIGYGWYNSNQKKSVEIEMRIKLENALADTIQTYQNQRGEWVSEKLTMQGNLDDVINLAEGLNKEKQELLKRVKEINKQKEVIAAALFSAESKIDSLLNIDVEIINDSTLAFSDSTVQYNYNIVVGNVQQFKTNNPYLLINKFSVPTDFFVSFNWNKNKREFYPVSFTVTPTNQYVSISNIESYAIPEINPVELKSTGWIKIGNFFKERWQDIIIGGAGFAGGYIFGATR